MRALTSKRWVPAPGSDTGDPLEPPAARPTGSAEIGPILLLAGAAWWFWNGRS